MASDLDVARARLLYRAKCLEVTADSSYLILDGPDAEVPELAGYAVSRNAHAGREAMDIRALLDSEARLTAEVEHDKDAAVIWGEKLLAMKQRAEQAEAALAEAKKENERLKVDNLKSQQRRAKSKGWRERMRSAIKVRDAALAREAAANERAEKLEDGMEIAWGVIANACGGNWDHPCNLPGWREAAERWRDENWHAITLGLKKRNALAPAPPTDEPDDPTIQHEEHCAKLYGCECNCHSEPLTTDEPVMPLGHAFLRQWRRVDRCGYVVDDLHATECGAPESAHAKEQSR